MLAILLKILTILGILLLCLLAFALTALFLVLFIPAVYRVCAAREDGKTEAALRIRWLFGLFRVDYRYPEPGRFTIRLLFFTLYDSDRKNSGGRSGGAQGRGFGGKDRRNAAGNAGDAGNKRGRKRGRRGKTGRQEDGSEDMDWQPLDLPGDVKQESSGRESDTEASVRDTAGTTASEAAGGSGAGKEAMLQKDGEKADGRRGGSGEEEKHSGEKRSAWEKIRYTIRSVCDRIKNILVNIRYYKELLAEDETKLLFADIGGHFGKLLRKIRPRRIKGSVVFGTGAPDTTGYCLGIYSMAAPFLGQDINVTPDFEEAVLRGRLTASGYVTVYAMAGFLLRLARDKRLRQFIRRLKREEYGNGR